MLKIYKPNQFNDIIVGESVAVNGICLTLKHFTEKEIFFDFSLPTKQTTTISELATNQIVNLERSLTLNDRLGGHIILGHVDCIGKIESIQKTDLSTTFKIAIEADVKKGLVNKGSIAIDGVSLTIAEKENDSIFTLHVIKQSENETCIKRYKIGQNVNIEFDYLVKIVNEMMVKRNYG